MTGRTRSRSRSRAPIRALDRCPQHIETLAPHRPFPLRTQQISSEVLPRPSGRVGVNLIVQSCGPAHRPGARLDRRRGSTRGLENFLNHRGSDTRPMSQDNCVAECRGRPDRPTRSEPLAQQRLREMTFDARQAREGRRDRASAPHNFDARRRKRGRAEQAAPPRTALTWASHQCTRPIALLVRDRDRVARMDERAS